MEDCSPHLLERVGNTTDSLRMPGDGWSDLEEGIRNRGAILDGNEETGSQEDREEGSSKKVAEEDRGQEGAEEGRETLTEGEGNYREEENGCHENGCHESSETVAEEEGDYSEERRATVIDHKHPDKASCSESNSAQG